MKPVWLWYFTYISPPKIILTCTWKEKEDPNALNSTSLIINVIKIRIKTTHMVKIVLLRWFGCPSHSVQDWTICAGWSSNLDSARQCHSRGVHQPSRRHQMSCCSKFASCPGKNLMSLPCPLCTLIGRHISLSWKIGWKTSNGVWTQGSGPYVWRFSRTCVLCGEN